MKTYFLRRILEAIPVFFAIATLAFFMVRFVPGGPFDKERTLPPETKEALNAYYGLDKPLVVQYGEFLRNLFRGDLGPSFKYGGWSVNEILAEKASVSLELGLGALAVSVFFGTAIGFAAAARRGKTFGGTLDILSSLGVCMPAFVVGPLLLLLFALKLGAVNAMGWNGLFSSDAILPVATLSLFYTAWIARLARSGALEESRKNYVRTAAAKGSPPHKIWLVHILPNAIQPTVSYLGPAAAGLLSGSFVVETIFQIPGLGKFFISSALDNDYTMLVGCVMLYAAFIIVFNLLSDLALALINPKIAKAMREDEK